MNCVTMKQDTLFLKKSISYSRIHEQLHIEGHAYFQLKKGAAFQFELTYCHEEKAWSMRIVSEPVNHSRMKFHRETKRIKEMLDLVLNSKKFRDFQPLIQKEIDFYSEPRELPDFKITSQFVGKDYGQKDVIYIPFTTEDTKEIGKLDYIKNEQGEWIVKYFYYPVRTYFGFKNDMIRKIEEEIKLLLLVQ